jgi:hypothetical protein
VFVLSVDAPAPAQESISIVQFTELQNRLGQGATIVTGVAAPSLATTPPSSDAFLAQSGGFLYLATTRRAAAMNVSPGAGLLRFTNDGRTPWDAGQISPAFDRGFARPTAMTFDPAARRIWMAGIDDDGGTALRWIDVDRPSDAATAGSLPLLPGARLTALAVIAAAPGSNSRYLLSLDSAGAIRRHLLTGPVIGEAQQLQFPYGAPAALTGSADGRLYIVIESGSRQDPVWELFALLPAVAPNR